MDRAAANEEAVVDRESEIWSCIFAEAPKPSREARLVCRLKHNVGSNPSGGTNKLIFYKYGRKVYLQWF